MKGFETVAGGNGGSSACMDCQNNKRVAVIFEGRDAAGKGSAIKRFRERKSVPCARGCRWNQPLWSRVSGISDDIKGYLPGKKKLCFSRQKLVQSGCCWACDGFCDKQQYRQFMAQVTDFEHMLRGRRHRSDQILVFNFKEEQKNRFEARLKST